MSFGNEIKDFVAAFQVGAGAVNNRLDADAKRKYMASQANYYDARSKYYSEGGAAGAKTAGPDAARAAGEAGYDARTGKVGDVAGGSYAAPPASDDVKSEIVRGALAVQEKYGYNPKDLVGLVGYETGGTYNPWQQGPDTSKRAGSPNQHIGLIQWGANERKQYGITKDMSPYDQMLAAGQFLKDRGLKPGMGFAQMYSTVNAGRPGLLNASDAAVGGAPGTVLDKVNSSNMKQHRQIAASMFDKYAGGATAPTQVAAVGPSPALQQMAAEDIDLDAAAARNKASGFGKNMPKTRSAAIPMPEAAPVVGSGALPVNAPTGERKPIPQPLMQDFFNKVAQNPGLRPKYLEFFKGNNYDTSALDEPEPQVAALPLD